MATTSNYPSDNALLPIGVVAPSSVVPQVELEMGIGRLKSEGFPVKIHGQVRSRDLFYAGKAEERAGAFMEIARDPQFPILYVARGGYGAGHLLPLLEKEAAPPKGKLLVGYSDATAFMNFVRERWGWNTLHAQMPANRNFVRMAGQDWMALTKWLSGESSREPWSGKRLQFIRGMEPVEIEAPLDGGNLAVLASLLGTPYQVDFAGKFVFFEDIDETLCRLDRLANHFLMSGTLNGAKGILLGDFTACEDGVPKGLEREVSVEKIKAHAADLPSVPIRKAVSHRRGIDEIFGRLGEALGIPVAYGLPVGHGPGLAPLPLGATYRLSRQGELKIANWDWLSKS